MEKKSILNSYKTFLKSCNFNIQILIQSKKENLEKHFFILEQEKNKQKITEEKKENLYKAHINFIKKINSENSSSSKNFYIIIHQKDEIKENSHKELEKIIIENLNEKYFKIKETLSKCGNYIYEIEKREIIDIFYSFLNTRKKEKI